MNTLSSEFLQFLGEPAVGTRYVAMLDILGFSDLVRRLPPHKIAAMVEDLVHRVIPNEALGQYRLTISPDGKETCYSQTYKLDAMHFSDTIVCWTPVLDGIDPEVGEMLVAGFLGCLSNVVYSAFVMGFPLRGGIAFGEAYINRRKGVIVGKAIVDAHETEAMQDWVGCAFHPDCPIDSETDTGGRCITRYPVPTKGDTKLDYALDWIRPALVFGQSKLKELHGQSPMEMLDAAFGRYMESNLPPLVMLKYLNARRFYDQRVSERPSPSPLFPDLD